MKKTTRGRPVEESPRPTTSSTTPRCVSVRGSGCACKPPARRPSCASSSAALFRTSTATHTSRRLGRCPSVNSIMVSSARSRSSPACLAGRWARPSRIACSRRCSGAARTSTPVRAAVDGLSAVATTERSTHFATVSDAWFFGKRCRLSRRRSARHPRRRAQPHPSTRPETLRAGAMRFVKSRGDRFCRRG